MESLVAHGTLLCCVGALLVLVLLLGACRVDVRLALWLLIGMRAGAGGLHDIPRAIAFARARPYRRGERVLMGGCWYRLWLCLPTSALFRPCPEAADNTRPFDTTVHPSYVVLGTPARSDSGPERGSLCVLDNPARIGARTCAAGGGWVVQHTVPRSGTLRVLWAMVYDAGMLCDAVIFGYTVITQGVAALPALACGLAIGVALRPAMECFLAFCVLGPALDRTHVAMEAEYSVGGAIPYVLGRVVSANVLAVGYRLCSMVGGEPAGPVFWTTLGSVRRRNARFLSLRRRRAAHDRALFKNVVRSARISSADLGAMRWIPPNA